MKLAALAGDVCAICGVSPHEHARCGTCEGNIQLLQLCRSCDRWNKNERVAWNRRRFHGLDDEDSRSSVPRSSRRQPRAHRDEIAPPRGRGRPRSESVDDAVLPLLLDRRVRVTVERIDLEGRNRGTYERWELISRREIARRAGCNHRAVNVRFHDYARPRSRDSRASSARPLTKNMK